jgi:outer membrane protein OmpA-like peptidoglycan-associated protein
MKKIHILLTTVAGLALGGCASSGDVSDVGQVRTVSPQGGTPFTQALAVEYRNHAIYEQDVSRETADAGWYARKGLRAAKGEVVLPSEVSTGGGDINRWGSLGPVIVVRKGSAPELLAARVRLMTFLDGGGRDRLPVVAARAQGYFDCWLEEAWEPDVVTQCRDEFLKIESQFTMTAAAATVPPPAAARMVNTFQVFFDFDRYNIEVTAAQIIDQAAMSAKKGNITRIELIGHTDAAGTVAYNQGLSERRADAVKKQLIKDGVPAAEITAIGVGKAKQLVPTADGVREPQNRRTEILLH